MSSERVERRLTAILAADVAGYSRLTSQDEEGTHARLQDHLRSLVDPKIAEHRGRVVKNTGDGLLAEFGSVVEAVRCALEVQRGMADRNAEVPQEKRIELRIGINVGDIIIDHGDIFGDGVNVAVRLEGIAEPGGICVSGRVLEDAQGKLDISFQDAGEQQLRNITRPVRVYRLRIGAVAGPRPNLVLPDKPSIAVLPFQNMSGDPEQDYFADGIVEEIITGLSRIRGLFVIARNSSFTYKGRAVDVKQVGRDLGVRYVLEGSVRKAGTRVRLTGQLIDASTGAHLWADRFDGTLEDIFVLQDEMTERVLTAIEPQLYAAEGVRIKRTPPESLDAWECVVRALSLINSRTRSDAATARELLQRAIVIDPGYAQAHSLLAFVTALAAHSGWEPLKNALLLASDAARKALLLDADEPWAHAALGFVLVLSRRPDDAVLEYEKALALNPNFAFVYTMLGAALCYLGRSKEALTQVDKAERLSPRDLLARGNRGANNIIRAAACLIAGQYRDGTDFARKAVTESPSSTPAYRQLIINSALAGEIEEARSALQTLKGLQPELSLQWVEQWLPFLGSDERQKYVEGLRLAGLE